MFKSFLSFLFTFIVFLFVMQANTSDTKHFFDGIQGNVIVIEETDCVIYSPNPSTDGLVTITTQNETSNVLSVELFNENGTVVFSQTSQQPQVMIDLSMLSDGDYTIQVRTSTCTGQGRCSIY